MNVKKKENHFHFSFDGHVKIFILSF